MAASRGAPASSEIEGRVASFFSDALREAREREVREKREKLRKRKADALLQLAQKHKSKPSQPGAPPPEHPSSESPEGEKPSYLAKSWAKPAAIAAASSSGSQEVVQTASAPEPLLRPLDRNSKKGQLLECLDPGTISRDVARGGHKLFELIAATMESWTDDVGLDRYLSQTMRPSPKIGVDFYAYNKATPPFNR